MSLNEGLNFAQMVTHPFGTGYYLNIVMLLGYAIRTGSAIFLTLLTFVYGKMLSDFVGYGTGYAIRNRF